PPPAGATSLALFRSKLWNVKSTRGEIGSWCRLKRTKPCPLKPFLNASLASLTGTLTPPPIAKLTRRSDEDMGGRPCARTTDAEAQAASARSNDQRNADRMTCGMGSTPLFALGVWRRTDPRRLALGAKESSERRRTTGRTVRRESRQAATTRAIGRRG